MLDRLEALGLEPPAMDIRITRRLRRERWADACVAALSEEFRRIAALAPAPAPGALRRRSRRTHAPLTLRSASATSRRRSL